MRTCPWCGGEMEIDLRFESEELLICKERCQHRRCQKCEVPIHRGSKEDSNYYDNNGNAGCYVGRYTLLDLADYEEIVGHQP